MTAYLNGQDAKLASVEAVVQVIVDAVERDQAIAYVPRKWQFTMWVIKHLPSGIYSKMYIQIRKIAK